MVERFEDGLARQVVAVDQNSTIVDVSIRCLYNVSTLVIEAQT